MKLEFRNVDCDFGCGLLAFIFDEDRYVCPICGAAMGRRKVEARANVNTLKLNPETPPPTSSTLRLRKELSAALAANVTLAKRNEALSREARHFAAKDALSRIAPGSMWLPPGDWIGQIRTVEDVNSSNPGKQSFTWNGEKWDPGQHEEGPNGVYDGNRIKVTGTQEVSLAAGTIKGGTKLVMGVDHGPDGTTTVTMGWDGKSWHVIDEQLPEKPKPVSRLGDVPGVEDRAMVRCQGDEDGGW